MNQTYQEFEVVIVVDGPDEATGRYLRAMADPRVRVVSLPRSHGAPTARNVGAKHARGDWTAMLDDDDEWHPEKLEVQLALGRAASVTTPIVTTRLLLRTPRADLVLPRRLPAPGESLCEYFTVRHGLFHGEGFIQTSTIMTRTELLRRVPFTPDLPRMQELDWALRALEQPDVGLVVAPQALVVWHADENRSRISSSSPWRRMWDWLSESRTRLTRRAYAALAMSVISSMAAPTRDVRVAWRILRDAQRNGQPRLIDYVTFLQIWLLPPDFRRRVRDLIKGRSRSFRTTPDARKASSRAGSTSEAA